MMSKRVCPSYNLNSKPALPLPGKYCARHSMLNMRLGAVPLIDVNMPNPLLTKYRSSQYGKIVKSWPVHGRHWLVKAVSVVVNCALPLDDRLTLVKVWPYKVKGKGSAMVVTVSSP